MLGLQSDRHRGCCICVWYTRGQLAAERRNESRAPWSGVERVTVIGGAGAEGQGLKERQVRRAVSKNRHEEMLSTSAWVRKGDSDGLPVEEKQVVSRGLYAAQNSTAAFVGRMVEGQRIRLH